MLVPALLTQRQRYLPSFGLPLPFPALSLFPQVGPARPPWRGGRLPHRPLRWRQGLQPRHQLHLHGHQRGRLGGGGRQGRQGPPLQQQVAAAGARGRAAQGQRVVGGCLRFIGRRAAAPESCCARRLCVCGCMGAWVMWCGCMGAWLGACVCGCMGAGMRGCGATGMKGRVVCGEPGVVLLTVTCQAAQLGHLGPQGSGAGTKVLRMRTVRRPCSTSPLPHSSNTAPPQPTARRAPPLPHPFPSG